MELKRRYHSRPRHVTEHGLILTASETRYWQRKVPKSKINSIENSSSHHLDRDLFPDSLVSNTANSSAAKHPYQNLSNGLPKSCLGFSVSVKVKGMRKAQTERGIKAKKTQKDMIAKQKPPTILKLGIATEVNLCMGRASLE